MLPEVRTAFKASAAILRGRAPGQLVIQFTDRCNARCPQCGMRVDEEFPRSTLESDYVREVIKTAAAKGVMSLSLTGGEPLLYAAQVIALLGFARRCGIRYTRTGTNGSVFREDMNPDVGSAVGRLGHGLREAGVYSFWISLDSADTLTHETARGLPGVVAAIRRALPVFHDAGVFPCANLGINRNMGSAPIEPMSDPHRFATQTRDALRDFYRAVHGMGFTTANVCYPMGFAHEDPVAAYRATSATDTVRFTAQERTVLFKVLAEVTGEFRSKLRIFTPLASLRALGAQHDGSTEGVAGCRGGVDFFYVSASDGWLYPCGFRGTEPLGDPTHAASWTCDGPRDCRSCDWECFRDPSQLLAPLLGLARHPCRTIHWAAQDACRARVWWRDLRYYAACDYFSAASPREPKRLSRFAV